MIAAAEQNATADRQQSPAIAVAWAARAEELADWALRRLVNRVDIWGGYTALDRRGQEYTKPDGTTGQTPKTVTRPATVKRGTVILNKEVLARHFRGAAVEHVVGLHTTSSENTSRWGATEIDWHGAGSSAPEINWRAALGWYEELRADGWTPLLTDSNGQGGYHLEFILADPAPTPDVYVFGKVLVNDFKRYGLPAAPEVFPKQKCVTEKNPCGNWKRLAGRHHTSAHWSRVWGGAGWLEGREAVDFILALRGNSPDLLYANRVAAYLKKLPNLGEGQGRDNVAYTFASWLVRDMHFSEETALHRLEQWDRGNTPPKGRDRLLEIIRSAHQYGRNEYGSGRKGTAGRKPAGEDDDTKDFRLGNLILRPGRGRKARQSGKLTVPVTVLEGGREVDRLTLSETVSGRREVVRLLLARLGEAAAGKDAVSALLGEILVYAAAALDGAAKRDGPKIRDVVSEKVVEALRPICRTDGGVWSEAYGREIKRAEFVAVTPEWLMDHCGNAADAPLDAAGEPVRRELLACVKTELEVCWATLYERLPTLAGASMADATAMGRDFWNAVKRMWTCLSTAEPGKGADGEEVAVRASLVRRVKKDGAAAYIAGAAAPGAREKWRPAHASMFAWWRPGMTEQGEIAVWLGLRWELSHQTHVDLPGVKDQQTFNHLGELFGVFDPNPFHVPKTLSGGRTKLAVLSHERAMELMGDPDEPPEGDSVTQ